MNELKPCPFCGSKNVIITNWGLWRCWCQECLAKTSDELQKRDAIKAWNRRTEKMKFALKNDDGIELHLNLEERKLLFNALRHYSAYGKNDSYIMEQMGNICEIMNVLDYPDFSKE
mgnify:CR=1 FL=1